MAATVSAARAMRRPAFLRDTRHLQLHWDAEHRVSRVVMDIRPRPCFTPEALDELVHHLWDLADAGEKVRYLVLASATPGIFSFGGDLCVVADYVRTGNEYALSAYVDRCVDLIWWTIQAPRIPLVAISQIEGSALSGGLEAALACQYMVVEQGARLGLPEIGLNLFSGMGAYQLLAWRLSPRAAEEIMLSGKVYCAEEFQAMGLVKALAPRGTAQQRVQELIERIEPRFNGVCGVLAARPHALNITRGSLDDVASRLVETLMRLSPEDLRNIDRLIRRQTRVAERARADARG